VYTRSGYSLPQTGQEYSTLFDDGHPAGQNCILHSSQMENHLRNKEKSTFAAENGEWTPFFGSKTRFTAVSILLPNNEHANNV
jgi:hypothetical protein